MISFWICSSHLLGYSIMYETDFLQLGKSYNIVLYSVWKWNKYSSMTKLYRNNQQYYFFNFRPESPLWWVLKNSKFLNFS